MKIIEAMKRVKANSEKIADLQNKIGQHCANLSHETPVYDVETANKVREWLQSCEDTTQENIRLLVAIQRTNSNTNVTIDLGGKSVTKTIAEWVWRRRQYAAIDLQTWSRLGDRGLKEGQINTSTGNPIPVTIVRHFDPVERDAKMAMYRSEPHQIDAALEVINATTEVME
jgi:hypothetical protein